MIPFLTLLLPTLSLSQLTLYPSSTSYPLAIHVPPVPPPYRTALFLHGNGSRGTLDDLPAQTTWDGMGLLMSMYDGGNKTGAQQIMGENFLVVLPLLGMEPAWWDPVLVMEVLNFTSTKYELDPDQISISGYSLGSIAAWNVTFFSPSTFSALIPSAGGADFSSSQLSSIPSTSVYVLAANEDEKESPSGITDNYQQLVGIRNSTSGANLNVTMEVLAGDHHLMTSTPFEELGVWEWLLNQKKVAGSSGGSSSSSTSTSSSTATSSSSSAPATSLKQLQGASGSSLQISSSAPLATTSHTGGARRGMRILWW